METLAVVSEQVKYTDELILNDIWRALWKNNLVRSTDIRHISVDVQRGRVTLTGHLSKENNRRRIEHIVRQVPGVTEIENCLVPDYDLTIRVAQALYRDERTRPYILPVGASHGWVRVDGEVPSRELQRIVEEVAAQTPQVRGVISLPRVPGEDDNPVRRRLQPQIGAQVYDRTGMAGTVSQVIINPRSRLVTHFAVHVRSGFLDGKFISGEYLVPVEAIDRVNEESVFLHRSGSPVHAYPAFDSEAYPLAPSSWQPPYPYRPGSVRWAAESREAALPQKVQQQQPQVPDARVRAPSMMSHPA